MGNYKLLNHQTKMLEFLQANPYAINGSEAGTGKTLPCIELMDPTEQTLVVAPAFLCFNWAAEIARFRPELEVALYPKQATVTVVSYSKLPTHWTKLTGYRYIIGDEIHAISNPEAKRSNAFYSLVDRNLPFRLHVLSGTIMRNRVAELYNIIGLLDQRYELGFFLRFGTHWDFKRRFMLSERVWTGQGYATRFFDYQNLQELWSWFKPWFLRFKLSEIESLPELQEQIIKYKGKTKINRELTEQWKTGSGSHVSTVKARNAEQKMVEFTKSYVEAALEAGEGPVVVFSDHVVAAEYLGRQAKLQARVITGQTSMVERDHIIRKFQAGEIPVLVGTIGAMGTGITLTASNLAVFNDLSWVPADNEQASKRIYRLSQSRDCRLVYVARDGIDYNITATLRKKTADIKAVIGD